MYTKHVIRTYKRRVVFRVRFVEWPIVFNTARRSKRDSRNAVVIALWNKKEFGTERNRWRDTPRSSCSYLSTFSILPSVRPKRRHRRRRRRSKATAYRYLFSARTHSRIGAVCFPRFSVDRLRHRWLFRLQRYLLYFHILSYSQTYIFRVVFNTTSLFCWNLT